MTTERMIEVTAKMHSLVARLEGMRSDNWARMRRDESMAWNGDEFFLLEQELLAISNSIAAVEKATEAENG